MSKTVTRVAMLLISVFAFALLGLLPIKTMASTAALNDGNIVWDPATKTVTISGEVKATDIVSSRLAAEGGWAHEVEHVVFLNDTTLVCDLDKYTPSQGLFGNQKNNADACEKLQTVYAGNLSLYVTDADTFCYAFSYCNSLETLDLSIANLTFADGVFPIFDCDAPYQNFFFRDCTSLSSLNLCGWDSLNMVYSNSYYGIAFWNQKSSGSPIAPSSLSFSKAYFSNETTVNDIDFSVPQGDYVGYINGISTGTTVNGYAEWKAFADTALESDTLYFVKAGTDIKTKTDFNANGGVFTNQSNATIIQSEDVVGNTLTLPAIPSLEGKKFLGWATASNATEPVIPAEATVLPKAGLSPNYYFAVWGEAHQNVSLTFNADGGIFSSTGTDTLTLADQVPGESIDSVEEPTREGYEYKGFKDSTDEMITFPYIVPDEDANYTAVWEEIPEPEPGTQDGWVQSDAGWQYVLDGEYLNDGWHYFEDEFGNHWYYFDEDTYMVNSRWIWDAEYDGWYWLCSTGPMIENLWQWIDNAWYGFWWGGKMCQGWVWDTNWNAWFYCYQDGIMAKSIWVDAYWVDWRGVWLH